MKKWFYPLLLALAVLGCSKDPEGSTTDPSGEYAPDGPLSVKVEIRVEGSGDDFASEISYAMRVRQYSNLELKLTPEDSKAVITYKSDDIGVARVSRNGSLTGRSQGTTDIHVLADGKKAAVCHLTVGEYEAVVESFKLDRDNVSLEWGSTQHVVVKTISPVGITQGDVSFVFSSSDEKVFTVENDSDGFGCKIEGIKPGKGTLHVDVKDASLDVPVTVTKKILGMEYWRYRSPMTDYEVNHVLQEKTLTIYYPTPLLIFLYDEESNSILKYSGSYSVGNESEETVNAYIEPWEWDYPEAKMIRVMAKGDGSSDDEGWGTISLHYENDLIKSDVEDIAVEFHGCTGIHGDMTIKSNHANDPDPERDLCAQTNTVAKGSKGYYRIGRISNKEIKGIYRFNTERDWIKVNGWKFSIQRKDVEGGVCTFWGWWDNVATSSAQISISTKPWDYGWLNEYLYWDDFADTGMMIAVFKLQ